MSQSVKKCSDCIGMVFSCYWFDNSLIKVSDISYDIRGLGQARGVWIAHLSVVGTLWVISLFNITIIICIYMCKYMYNS